MSGAPDVFAQPAGCIVAMAGAQLGGDSHTGLLYSHPLAQQHLAPSLLLLYGDVEHTGYVAVRESVERFPLFAFCFCRTPCGTSPPSDMVVIFSTAV